MAAVVGVEVVSDTILKPFSSPSTPRHPLHNALVPLTPFDMANYDVHVAILYAFHPPMPDNADMIDGLAKALAYFPHLAGRFVAGDHGYPHVLLNDAGIRLKEATAPTALEDNLPFDYSSASFLSLHPHPADGVEVLLQIQLTRFSCGGLSLGLTSHHRIGDGASICHFLFAWAELVRGVGVGVLPYFDWAAVCTPRDPPASEFNHVGAEFRRRGIPREPTDTMASLSRMQNLSVHFTRELVAKLKHQVTEGGPPGGRVSTVLCVLAHVWKKTTLARGLADDEVTQVRMVVNGRQRIKPPVPMEYYGNLVLWAYPKMKAGDLLRASYSRVVQIVRDAVNEVDDSYFKSFIDFGESLMEETGSAERLESTMPAVGDFLNPNIEFNSWLSLRFHELDFGGGAPCAFLPPGLPVEGLMILVPSCGETGGVDVYMALDKEHAATFREVFYSLD